MSEALALGSEATKHAPPRPNVRTRDRPLVLSMKLTYARSRCCDKPPLELPAAVRWSVFYYLAGGV